jgi:hypothetical protein
MKKWRRKQQQQQQQQQQQIIVQEENIPKTSWDCKSKHNLTCQVNLAMAN